MFPIVAPGLHTAYTLRMGLFRGDKRDSDLAAALPRALAMLNELQIDVEKLKSQHRNLELEWINAHEKLKQISGRIAKRQGVDAKEAAEAAAADTDPTPLPQGPTAPDQVTAGIWARRNRNKR